MSDPDFGAGLPDGWSGRSLQSGEGWQVVELAHPVLGTHQVDARGTVTADMALRALEESGLAAGSASLPDEVSEAEVLVYRHLRADCGVGVLDRAGLAAIADLLEELEVVSPDFRRWLLRVLP